VQATGVDALAVAVGTSHAMTERHVSLDLELIKELRAAVPVPLVLHGSSGVPDQELVNAVESGMTKINIATHLNHVFTDSVRATLAASPEMVDSRRYLGPARDALKDEAERLLRLLYRPLTTAVAIQGLLALDRMVHDRLTVTVGNPVRRGPRLMEMVDRQIRQFRDIAPDVAPSGSNFSAWPVG
jgi:hypothetical protein